MAENAAKSSNRGYNLSFPEKINLYMTYWGLKKKEKEKEKRKKYKGSNIYSPDGYVDQVERENALRNKEESVTEIPDSVADFLVQDD